MRHIAAGPSSRNVAIGRPFSANAVVIDTSVCFPARMVLMQTLRAIKFVVRNIFARETLEEVPVAPRADPRTRHVRSIFAAEALATDPETPSAPRAGILRMLFAPEALREDPVGPPAAARPGILAALFAPEELPELPAEPPRRAHTTWLRWLFRFEPLDPPGR